MNMINNHYTISRAQEILYTTDSFNQAKRVASTLAVRGDVVIESTHGMVLTISLSKELQK